MERDEQYVVLYKDIPVFYINRVNGNVQIYDESKMPFDIYLEESDSFDDRLNNIQNFNSWCSERMLSLDRKYAKEILNFFQLPQRISDNERALITIAFRGVTINDCFWIKKIHETVTWSDINLFENSLQDAILEVALTGYSPTINNKEIKTPDISTAGKAPKAWRRTDNGFELLKGDVNDSVDREVEASQMLNKLGIKTVLYHKEYFNDTPVSVCKCFTSQDINFARAGYVDIWCMNHDIEFSDLLIKHKRQFDMMNLADYLVGNSDEHPDNWGIVYDNDMNILDVSPIMDFDHAFEASDDVICQPAAYLGMHITQKEYAMAVIGIYKDDIDFACDLSEFKYGGFVKDRLKLLQASLESKAGNEM